MVNKDAKAYLALLEKDDRIKLERPGSGHGLVKIFDAKSNEYVTRLSSGRDTRALKNAQAAVRRHFGTLMDSKALAREAAKAGVKVSGLEATEERLVAEGKAAPVEPKRPAGELNKERVFDAIVEMQSATVQQVATLFLTAGNPMSEVTVRKHLNALVEDGLIDKDDKRYHVEQQETPVADDTTPIQPAPEETGQPAGGSGQTEPVASEAAVLSPFVLGLAKNIEDELWRVTELRVCGHEDELASLRAELERSHASFQQLQAELSSTQQKLAKIRAAFRDED